MNRFRHLLFLLSAAANVWAQGNLVPNGDFEIYSGCPSKGCEISNAVGWYSAGFTPDYFNVCDSLGGHLNFGVPQNASRYQLPASGNAYAGITTYCPSFSTNSREYIGAKLKSLLVKGQEYDITLKVSLGDRPGIVCCAVNKIGVLFSTISHNLGNDSCNLVPGLWPINFDHISNNSIITDTSGWTSITGSFIADSAYQYILIGNFFDDSNTDTVCYCSYLCAYYYVDDVTVVENTTNEVMDNRLEQKIMIFPTVADNMLYVQISGFHLQNAQIIIYDLFGDEKGAYTLVQNSKQINITNIPAGIYLLNIISGNSSFFKKFIINH